MHVSIITASYNYENYIKETIESVLAQTYPNWELIIVDDGSKDNSVKIIEEYCKKDSRIKLFQHVNGENKGLIKTIMLGLSKAQNDWIAFLEADDSITPDYLQKKIDIINQNPEVQFIFNDINLFGDEDVIQKISKYFIEQKKVLDKQEYPANLLKYFQNNNIVPTFSCVMLNKGLLQEINFNSPVQAWVDYYIWVQIAQKVPFYYINEKLTNWRQHKTSYNQQRKEQYFSIAFFNLFIKSKTNTYPLSVLYFWYLPINIFTILRKWIFRFHLSERRIYCLGKWYNFAPTNKG